MGKPLPVETRRAIVRLIKRGDCSQADIARIFQIGHRSVQRYWSLFRQTGDVDSHAKFGGHKRTKLSSHEDRVRKLVEQKPDITLVALKESLSEQHIETSRSALERFLKSLGYSNKKNGIWSRAETQGRSGSKGSVQKTAKRARSDETRVSR